MIFEIKWWIDFFVIFDCKKLFLFFGFHLIFLTLVEFKLFVRFDHDLFCNFKSISWTGFPNFHFSQFNFWCMKKNQKCRLFVFKTKNFFKKQKINTKNEQLFSSKIISTSFPAAANKKQQGKKRKLDESNNNNNNENNGNGNAPHSPQNTADQTDPKYVSCFFSIFLIIFMLFYVCVFFFNVCCFALRWSLIYSLFFRFQIWIFQFFFFNLILFWLLLFFFFFLFSSQIL